MAYQLYKKMLMYGGRQLRPTDISITRTSFGLGKVISEDLKNFECVEVYVDMKTKKVGFKGSNDMQMGFSMQCKKTGNIAYLAIVSLSKTLPKGRYRATKEDGMWVIDVPEMEIKDNSD